MKAIHDAWLIQIDITNACIHKCSHCTRGVPHVRKPFFMDLELVERALKSLEGWRYGVGCMGGEPTLHPQFPEICELYKKYVPKKHRGILTTGGKKYEQYKDLIDETFGYINFNDHYATGYHQPLMVASEEIVKDEDFRRKLVDNCWLQRTWSPTITPRGCFFCEVAATFDLLFNGPGGYPIEAGWWKKKPKDFADQRERYCRYCSIAIPLGTYKDNLNYDYVSPGNAERLKAAGSPRAAKDGLRLIDKPYTKEDWKEHRRARKPEQYADPGTEHFWYRNSMKFTQKRRSIPHKIKSVVNEFLMQF